jgi:hypothetical protein
MTWRRLRVISASCEVFFTSWCVATGSDHRLHRFFLSKGTPYETEIYVVRRQTGKE